MRFFLFTFQYGEIKSCAVAKACHVTLIFTFQYGEIKSCGCLKASSESKEFTFQYGEIKRMLTKFSTNHCK